MINLVVHRLMKTHPELVPQDMNAVDAVREAHVPMTFKRDFLDFIWRKTGPKMLLSVGQEILNVSYDPIWYAAVRSGSPAMLFDKWQRFEIFGHSKNRLRIEQMDDKFASFQRYATDGKVPTIPENLLICGLIISLMKEIGCIGLCCEMQVGNGEVFTVFEDGCFSVPEDSSSLETSVWTIRWKSFSPRAENVTLSAELLDSWVPEACDPKLKTLIGTVILVLMSDVARQWKVGEVAHEASLSTRSLQRRLRGVDRSFSSLVRLVRIHEACRLLKDCDAPVTAIGFCAGFSDSAHFSRDFRASMGMTPSDYRAVC